ncbi:MAG: class IV adenylate cyclase [Planctomycetaceae bacterium]|jgi:adenylate cyclase, class 2|nr:class IV adenylate cyclase [bacterium]MDG2391131.1 class IV adenylate cyclase [Planctomycetaceae bacterium]
MSYEVEMKFPLNDTKHFVPILRGVGAEEAETQTHIDRYYNHPAKDFAETDEALRLRSIGDRNVITYKGPKIDLVTKTRQEIEVDYARGADSVVQLAQVLTLLGFRESLTVHKTRRVFHLDWHEREVEVLLDNVEGLGEYAEIETIALEGDQDAAKECVLSLAEKLGLEESERRSYLRMLIEKNVIGLNLREE